jgi:squalene-hopene/tetraprenyl-beta-curcumene cyclase
MCTVSEAYDRVCDHLLSVANERGVWRGRLSSSALATAIAVFALARIDRERHAVPVSRGLRWLLDHANADGGWGDSPESPSNLTATILAWSALTLADAGDPGTAAVLSGAETWLAREAGGLEPAALRRAVIRRYGNDRTFAAPILTMCTLAGRLGAAAEAWRGVPQLPFELAVMPHACFRWMKLTVVSYALPALIAIGLVRHRRRPSAISPWRRLRDALTPRLLALAARMQPANGGYEEATPLTAFVAMSLAEAGERKHVIVRRAEAFLEASMREDGSWPIDTDLATWVTTLTVNALSETPQGAARLDAARRERILAWLLAQQHDETHPLTHGAPGGWSWTDLPGGMPDADDTAGALLALRRLVPAHGDARACGAAEAGLGWLLDLQNSDGGIPTFSRGWGRLPFDRSCPDITAHTVRAAVEWRAAVTDRVRRRLDRALGRMLAYLRAARSDEGAWVPLWFGDQGAAGEANLTYGTAQVVMALRAVEGMPLPVADLLGPAYAWLRRAQNDDGGWGGAAGVPSTVEQTALAVRALAGLAGHEEAVGRGVRWLLEATRGGARFTAAPIGLYFARLWYSETMYPRIFTALALGAVTAGEERMQGANDA